MIKEKNKKNKSLIELAISDSKNFTEEEKLALRNWLNGIVEYVNKTSEVKNIYRGYYED